MNYAKTIKIVPAKPRVIFPHLLNLSRSSMAWYMENKKERGLDGSVAQIYFNAAYGLESIGTYERMATAFNLSGEINEG